MSCTVPLVFTVRILNIHIPKFKPTTGYALKVKLFLQIFLVIVGKIRNFYQEEYSGNTINGRFLYSNQPSLYSLIQESGE